jgi:hypothetical protein
MGMKMAFEVDARKPSIIGFAMRPPGGVRTYSLKAL